MRTVTVSECAKIIKHKYLGYLYCFETATGLIKIGQTSDLAGRIKRHYESNLSYGFIIKGVMISEPHTNHIESEKQLFDLLSMFRWEEVEVFKCSFLDVIKAVNKIELREEIEKSASDESYSKNIEKIQADRMTDSLIKALDKRDEQQDKKETTMMFDVLFNGNWPPKGSALTSQQCDDLDFIIKRNSAYIDIKMSYDDRKTILADLYLKRNQKRIA